MADPLPGRPESLGRATDLRDARAVLAILNACAETLGPERPRIGLIRIVREALWFIWEAPRLPRPLVATKYPEPYPWSSGARAVFTEHAGKRPRGGWGFVIEHLYPRELLVADLLNDAASIGPADAVELLTDRLMAAVVTRHEDRWLPTRAESARPWADYASDSWLRYRASGLDLDAFARLRD